MTGELKNKRIKKGNDSSPNESPTENPDCERRRTENKTSKVGIPTPDDLVGLAHWGGERWSLFTSFGVQRGAVCGKRWTRRRSVGQESQWDNRGSQDVRRLEEERRNRIPIKQKKRKKDQNSSE